MFPSDVIGQERIADLLREGERERLARRPAEARAFVRRAKVRGALNRRPAEARAFVRRAKVRGALNLVVGTFALARRKRVVRSA